MHGIPNIGDTVRLHSGQRARIVGTEQAGSVTRYQLEAEEGDVPLGSYGKQWFDLVRPSRFTRVLEYVYEADRCANNGLDVLADDAIDRAIEALHECRPSGRPGVSNSSPSVNSGSGVNSETNESAAPADDCSSEANP